MKNWILLAAVVALSSCGDYGKVLKNTDPAYRLERATTARPSLFLMS
jgi:hypothetical protein